ncbi:hypothetical protein MWK58_20010 [Escherichia coli]|nr:hypothetical protein [Escherichia coli]
MESLPSGPNKISGGCGVTDVSSACTDSAAKHKKMQAGINAIFCGREGAGDFINHSPLAKPNKTVFKYQKTLVQDRTSCMIEITFCELTDILEKGIKGINNGEIE